MQAVMQAAMNLALHDFEQHPSTEIRHGNLTCFETPIHDNIQGLTLHEFQGAHPTIDTVHLLWNRNKCMVNGQVVATTIACEGPKVTVVVMPPGQEVPKSLTQAHVDLFVLFH
jgi:hypothetical protein